MNPPLIAALAARVHPGLVLAAACWLAACAVPLAFVDVAGFVLAGLFGVALLASGRASRKQHIPFGPFIILGAFLVLLL